MTKWYTNNLISVGFALACTACSTEKFMVTALCNNKIGLIKLALKAGWDPNTPYTLRDRDATDSQSSLMSGYEPATQYTNLDSAGGLSPLMYRFEPALVCDMTTQTMEVLIEAGANVNLAMIGSRTPLHDAADQGELEFVKFFVGHGANVNVRDGNGWLPFSSTSNLDVAKYLLRAGTDLTLYGKDIQKYYDMAKNRFKDDELLSMMNEQIEKD